jgi:hypothetical protein
MNTNLKKLYSDRSKLIPVKRYVTKRNDKGEKYEAVEHLSGNIKIGNRKYKATNGTLRRILD